MGESSQESQELDNLLIDSTTPLATRDNGWTWKRLSIKSTTQQSLDFKQLWSCQPSLDNMQITRKELRISLAICPGTNKAPNVSWCLCTSQSSLLRLQDMWQPKTMNPWQLGLQPRHPLVLLWHRWLMISWLTSPSKLTIQQPPDPVDYWPPFLSHSQLIKLHWKITITGELVWLPLPLCKHRSAHTHTHMHTHPHCTHIPSRLCCCLHLSNLAAWRNGKEAEFFFFFFWGTVVYTNCLIGVRHLEVLLMDTSLHKEFAFRFFCKGC